MLNGRAPGDQEGRFTCTKNGGHSVVDYGIVSASLYSSVHSFVVQDFDGTLSTDHAALTMTVALQRQQPAVPTVGAAAERCCRTYRPTPDQVIRYVDALKEKETEFQRVTQHLAQGIVSPSVAL